MKRANISNGHQKINNNTVLGTAAGTREIQTEQDKLLVEHTDGSTKWTQEQQRQLEAIRR